MSKWLGLVSSVRSARKKFVVKSYEIRREGNILILKLNDVVTSGEPRTQVGRSGPEKRRYCPFRSEKRVLVGATGSLRQAFRVFGEGVVSWGARWERSGLDFAAVDATDVVVVFVDS